jgi:DNA-binding beta-propeller fold protein YncE
MATDSGSDDTGRPPVVLPARLAVTADFLAQRLSLVDLDALAGGATTRDAIVVGEVDLSAYVPGPLEVEIAPDGQTAVVAISPGFYGGFVGTTIGVTDLDEEGVLLLVDLATQTVTAEIETGHVPMGIAITPDGTLAYTANYGTGKEVGDTMSIVDLAAGTLVEDVVVGARPEQVAFDETGTWGMINLASDGTVRTFETADPAGTLSVPLPISDDPSDVAFVPGTSRAVVASSIGPSTYVVVDVTDPAMPTVLETAPEPGGATYPITHIPGTTEVLVGATDFGALKLLRVDVATDPSTVTWLQQLPDTATFPLSAAVDLDGGVALVDAPGVNQLVVFALDGSGATAIDWQDEIGPTYVAIAP